LKQPTGLDIRKQRRAQIDEYSEEPLQDFEYLTHHVTRNESGRESLWHCFLYDHIANLYEQRHLVVKNGKATIDGSPGQDGTYHVIIGLEPTQDIMWSDEDAKKAGIAAKAMKAGMKATQKSKEW